MSAARAAPEAPALDPRKAIVEALMRLAAEEPFEDIRIKSICEAAGVTLGQFRELFPSKGAVLGAFSRMIDNDVLARPCNGLENEGPRDRMFDVLMARLDAMAPYKAGLKGVTEWAYRDPVAAYNLNSVLLNSMRFMMEAADLDYDGLHGALKLQGLVGLWGRVLDVWFNDDDPGLARTMAELDRRLERGGRVARRLDDMHRMTSPIRNLAAAMFSNARCGRRPSRRGDDYLRDDDSIAPSPRDRMPGDEPMRGGWPDEEPPTKYV